MIKKVLFSMIFVLTLTVHFDSSTSLFAKIKEVDESTKVYYENLFYRNAAWNEATNLKTFLDIYDTAPRLLEVAIIFQSVESVKVILEAEKKPAASLQQMWWDKPAADKSTLASIAYWTGNKAIIQLLKDYGYVAARSMPVKRMEFDWFFDHLMNTDQDPKKLEKYLEIYEPTGGSLVSNIVGNSHVEYIYFLLDYIDPLKGGVCLLAAWLKENMELINEFESRGFVPPLERPSTSSYFSAIYHRKLFYLRKLSQQYTITREEADNLLRYTSDREIIEIINRSVEGLGSGMTD